MEVQTPHGAPEATCHEARPRAAAGEELRPLAPEAPVVPHEAVFGDAPQAGPRSADRPDASNSPQADHCAKRLGRFRVDVEALRKRKEALGGEDRPCRLLKRRKYFATNE